MKKRGFTLIELMIVVAIIGILLAMLLPRVSLLIDRSRERTTGKNLKNIYAAMMQYAERGMGRFAWPTSVASAQTALTGLDPITSQRPFDKIPYTLLRRSLNITDDNTIVSVEDPPDADGMRAGMGYDGGWCYITAGTYTGELFIDASQVDTFGNIYSLYPCQ